MELKAIAPSEASQGEKDKSYSGIIYIWNLNKQAKLVEADSNTMVTRCWGVGVGQAAVTGTDLQPTGSKPQKSNTQQNTDNNTVFSSSNWLGD